MNFEKMGFKSVHMLKNYFRAAFRMLSKSKGYSFLNIFGLSVGVACAGLIFLWAEDELTFNHNFSKRDLLYRVMQNGKSDEGITTRNSTPGPMAEAVKAEIPGIANSGRFSWAMDEIVVLGEKSIKENGMYGDPSIISMFTLSFINGNPSSALDDPNSVVISESMSKKFFGDENPVGKTLTMNAKGAYSVDGIYMVKGVFGDLPANCSYHFEWLSPYKTWEDANTWLKPWNNNLTETIVELSTTTDSAKVNAKLFNYLSKKVSGATNQCFLFPMNDWHLRDHFVNGVQQGGDIKYVRLFLGIALIILIIACINFMNLSTARSEQRAKEVGVLKVMGAGRQGLIRKFLAESLFMSIISVILALALLYAFLPFYNNLVNKQLSIGLSEPRHLVWLLGIGLLTGFLAGSYPAFYLSSFNPVAVLKGLRIRSSTSAIFIRKGLVVVQFAASVMLIISTIVIYEQVQYIRNRDIGYSKSNLIYLGMQGNLKDHFEEIKNKLIATGYVENAATSLHDALHVYSSLSMDGLTWRDKDPNAKTEIHNNVVSPEYISAMGFKIVSGRDFYRGNADATSVIINESMATLMGNAGKIGSIIGSGPNNPPFTVVGIVKNFVYNDVYGAATPLIFLEGTTASTVMALRFRPNVSLPQALQKTESVLKSENPGFPFEFNFADKDFEAMFAAEKMIGKLAGVFAVLAIFISCLGLFGLASYTAERRTKEIGIRKVLGARSAGIAGLMAREFIQLVILSFAVAFPAAWWYMNHWLQEYAYRTTIAWWIFALTGVSAMAIALGTVAFQSIRAALANPVKSLRTEG